VKHILITGAAGAIGTALRAAYQGRYRLRLTDIAPLGKAAAGEELVNADITDLAACVRMMEGVDCVVHLGGTAVEDAWEKILPANIAGCYNVIEAARRAGVTRVIFASSNHRRLRRIQQPAQPLGQQQCRVPRLPPAGRCRDLRGGYPRAGRGGKRNIGAVPRRLFHADGICRRCKQDRLNASRSYSGARRRITGERGPSGAER